LRMRRVELPEGCAKHSRQRANVKAQPTNFAICSA
jgi:hypothetical protein